MSPPELERDHYGAFFRQKSHLVTVISKVYNSEIWKVVKIWTLIRVFSWFFLYELRRSNPGLKNTLLIAFCCAQILVDYFAETIHRKSTIYLIILKFITSKWFLWKSEAHSSLSILYSTHTKTPHCGIPFSSVKIDLIGHWTWRRIAADRPRVSTVVFIRCLWF